MQELLSLFGNLAQIRPGHVIMWVIGGILIYLAIILFNCTVVFSYAAAQELSSPSPSADISSRSLSNWTGQDCPLCLFSQELP